MGYKFEKYSIGGGGASEAEVVQIVKTNFEGGVGYEESGETVIVAEQTITIPSDGYILPSVLPLTEGDTYTVNFDGASYECVATVTTNATLGEILYLGNVGMLGSTPATSEPFLIVNVISANISGAFASEGDHTLSISGYATIAHKIEAKYLDVIGKPGTGTNAEAFNGVATESASGAFSHAEGQSTTATGQGAHSEGIATAASGVASHAETYETIASGDYSHAEGTRTVASASAAHAEGSWCKASGVNSHAEGHGAIANGYGAHAEGRNTKASSNYQHVQGKFNIEDTEDKYAHIVGNGGSEDDRSNAHTLDWDGNAWFAGNIKVGGTGYDDPNAVEVGGSGGSGGTKSFMLTYSEAETTDTSTTLKFTGVTNTTGNKYLNRLVTKITAYEQTLAAQIQNTQAVVGASFDAGTIMFNITADGVSEPFYAFLKIYSSRAELVFEYETLTEDMQTVIGTIQYSDYIRVDYEEV